ncbi:Putative pre-16S rRNA nuclease [Frankliniella fusca]|uniref:Pre-16S rRNA nuclease n=1 Tax=Frankliniella fusca TaxID=407009 RepID=A0AAE1HSF6_9NEOP|nr:Putative pre-16S rRNA nuclease [Frankliniella fusca]
MGKRKLSYYHPNKYARSKMQVMRYVTRVARKRTNLEPLGDKCSFLDSKYVGEDRKGFRSVLRYKCTKCHLVTRIDTDMCEDNEVDVNTAMTLGALAGGGGFANLQARVCVVAAKCLQEMAAAVDMHCMTQKTYISYEQKLGLMFELVTLEEMKAAGKEERRLAVWTATCPLAGDICPDEVPWIRVIADGMWSKRSYGSKYDALSGVAFIIGARTKKILFYGVRNKHCYVCTLDEQKQVKRSHTCATNFNGPSTQMEASIILEGFKASEEMHELRYLQLVGDRDSSVYNSLIEAAPYGYGAHYTVQKIDCKNHLLRNYRTWCMQLSGNTQFPLPDGVNKSDSKAVQFWKKELRSLRCLIRDNTKRLSNAISKASTYRGAQNGSLTERTQNLENDIRNATCHVFGDHSKCEAYFCQTVQTRMAAAVPGPSHRADPAPPGQLQVETAPEAAIVNWVPRLQKSGLWGKLQEHLETMAKHARSLIHNLNNNMCEVANSQVAKFISGKRVFYSRRASFNARCAAAALAMNTSGAFRQVVHKNLQNGTSPGNFTAKHSAIKVKRLTQQRERRAKRKSDPAAAQRRRLWSAPNKDYGLEARAPGDRDESVDEPSPTIDQPFTVIQLL